MADPGDRHRRPIGEAIGSALRGTVIVGALLLLPAGLVADGWLWPHGLLFVGACGAVIGAGNLILAVWRPDHFRVRQQSVVAARERSSH